MMKLKYEILKINREDALNQLLIELNINNWKISYLKSTIEKYKHKNSKGKYRSYCGIILYFLIKKLKQKEKNSDK